MPGQGTGEGQCVLCGRGPLPLTRHHLVPRRVHRKPRFRKAFSRQALQQQVILVCRPCHNFIHYCRSEQDLALNHNTLETLRDIPELESFTDWLGQKPAGFVPKARSRRR